MAKAVIDENSLLMQKIIGQIEDILGRELTGVEKKVLIKDTKHTYKEINGRIYNSYVDEEAIDPYRDFTVLGFIERTLKTKPIITGNCTLYKNEHLKGRNTTGQFVKFLKDSRGKYKKERDKKKKEKLEIQSKSSNDEAIRKLDALIGMNDSYQSVFKIFTNAYYGCVGMRKFIFNDKNSGPAVTGCGVQIITTLIQSFEAFIADNWKMDNFSDILYFLNKSKEKSRGNFDYEISQEITKDLLKKRLYSKVKGNIKELQIKYPKIYNKIEEVINSMTQEEIEDAYYRNNLIKFLENESILEDIGNALDFFIPSGNIGDIQKQIAESGNEKLKEAVERLNRNIGNIVFFNHYFEDRYAFAMRGKNKSVIVVDTDSNFLMLDHFFRVIKEYYDIYNEDGTMDPKLRLSIGSLFIYPILHAAAEFLYDYGEKHNIDEALRPELNLKNEFFYKRLMLTYAKKNYAGLTMSQEGVLKDPMELDVKGLALMKSTTSKYIKNKFLDIIEKKILSPEYIDINDIIHDYIQFSEEVVNSIKNGDITYCKPMKYGSTYKDPYRQEVVRGVVLWNQIMREKNQIEPLENVNSIKLIGKTEAEVNDIIEQNKDFFTESDFKKLEAMKKCIFYGNEVLKSFGLSVICMPKAEEKLPHWAIPFVDVESMVKNALSPTLIVLQSLGIMVDDVERDERFTNIVDL